VRPVIVVVEFVSAQYGHGVALADDQDAVEEFAADAADEAFGDGVGDDAARAAPVVAGRGDRGVLRHAVSWFAGR
jgi:hypothetical protein